VGDPAEVAGEGPSRAVALVFGHRVLILKVSRPIAVSGRVDGGDGEPIRDELAHFRFTCAVDTSIVMDCNQIRHGDDVIAVRV
jgi:hypothetical protein